MKRDQFNKPINHLLYVLLVLLLAGFNSLEASKEGSGDVIKFTELEPHNGFYQRFVGQVTLDANLAVLADNPRKIYVVIPIEYQAYFPFLNTGEEVMLIQLIDSEKLLEDVTLDLNNQQEGYVVIGRSKIEFDDFNIAGDCGLPSYFSFKYRLIDQVSEVAAYSIEEKGC